MKKPETYSEVKKTMYGWFLFLVVLVIIAYAIGIHTIPSALKQLMK